MVRALIITLVKNLVRIQMGQSKIRKYIPDPYFQRLKVLKYNLWLIYITLSRNAGFNLFRLVKVLTQKRKCILFYPDIPYETSVITRFCLERGYKITNDISGHFDAAFKWKDATFYQPDEKLSRLAETREVINFHCNDISKVHVDKVFAEVFGYSSIVDPAITMGKCVRKSNSNAAHDGQIIDCPIKIKEEGSVYQILIDNQVDDDQVMDIRVPVYRDVISEYLSIWIKPKEARFLVNFGERRCAHPSEILSQEEQQNILHFCRKLGLEFGELDVLRHRPDGKIYIIDANPTPDGGEIPIEQEREDFILDALLFETIFLDS